MRPSPSTGNIHSVYTACTNFNRRYSCLGLGLVHRAAVNDDVRDITTVFAAQLWLQCVNACWGALPSFTITIDISYRVGTISLDHHCCTTWRTDNLTTVLRHTFVSWRLLPLLPVTSSTTWWSVLDPPDVLSLVVWRWVMTRSACWLQKLEQLRLTNHGGFECREDIRCALDINRSTGVTRLRHRLLYNSSFHNIQHLLINKLLMMCQLHVFKKNS